LLFAAGVAIRSSYPSLLNGAVSADKFFGALPCYLMPGLDETAYIKKGLFSHRERLGF